VPATLPARGRSSGPGATKRRRPSTERGLSGDPEGFSNLAGDLLFTARDGTHGRELWKTDGTAAGTKSVKDIRPGGNGSSPGELTRIGDTVFFIANDGVRGRELWRSDGTTAGTTLVKDVNPGRRGSGLASLTNVKGMLYLTAFNGSPRPQLWTSDGTASGTHPVKRIVERSRSGVPLDNLTLGGLTAVRGTLYFTSWTQPCEVADPVAQAEGVTRPTDCGYRGISLWTSDGTRDGTTRVKKVSPYPDDRIADMTEVAGKLYFTSEHGYKNPLWSSDGTAAGTTKVKVPVPPDFAPYELTDVGGTLYFISFHVGSQDRELWKSDGTSDGTALVKDINPGGYSFLEDLITASGRLFFTGDDGIHGYGELFTSDGTQDGTQLVKDINPAGDASLYDFTPVGGRLFFFSGIDQGLELWVSDGTEEGTTLVKAMPGG
jgi:ELWxxDGT repeat protein